MKLENGAILNVSNSLSVIMEPDEGENVTVTSCFTSQLREPLFRDAVFLFNVSNMTTATNFIFSTASPVLVIPAQTSYFVFCADVTIFGNDVFDGNRRIIINVTAVSPFDRVSFSNFTGALIVYIVEDDSKSIHTHHQVPKSAASKLIVLW